MLTPPHSCSLRLLGKPECKAEHQEEADVVLLQRFLHISGRGRMLIWK